jgi:hypothetical protein
MFKTFAAKALLTAAGLAVVAPAPALAGNWGAHHPRREQVNDRLQNLNRKIRQERREGDLTKSQAQGLRKEDRTIRDEERDMAKLDNGHITKADQKLLNQQENELRSDIPK